MYHSPMRIISISGLAVILFSTGVQAFDPNSGQSTGGVLDEPILMPGAAPANRPVPMSIPLVAPTVLRPFDVPARDPNLDSSDPEIRQEAVKKAVSDEIETLQTLPVAQVEARANAGERAAQVVLGTEFAKEAQSLIGIPAAANQAAEDAVRWYNQAARRGFPGAPSLDYAGVSFYPIRIQRAPAPR